MTIFFSFYSQYKWDESGRRGGDVTDGSLVSSQMLQRSFSVESNFADLLVKGV